jgi:hypothetical protein
MKPAEVFQENAGKALVRTRRFARRLADLWPLTPLGMALGVVASVALFRFGFEKLDLVLLVLGYGAIGILAISLAAVLLVGLALHWSLRRNQFEWSSSVLETGLALPTGFALPSFRWFPLVQLRWLWITPSGVKAEQLREGSRLQERVTLSRRGIVSSVTRRFIVQDAFGLARVSLRRAQPGPLHVMPHLGGIRRLPVLTSLAGGEEHPHPMGLEDGDRVELRRYVPGDSARFIHWKVFGRTRKLMVRVPERALSRARRTIAYLVSGPHDEAAAAAARAAIEEEVLGANWQFGADGSPEATADRDDALHKVMVSGAFPGPSGSGLERFLAQVDPQGPAALVIFAPPVLGPWLDEVRRVSTRRYGRVRVVIAVDAVHSTEPEPAWRKWLLTSRQPRGVARYELQQVGRALGQLRCEVLIVDRVSGRILGDGLRLAVAGKRAA